MANAAILKVMIMAGGTGGHVFPALAVAEVLRKRDLNIEWLGTARGIENTVVPAAKIPLHHIRVKGVRGHGPLGLLKAPFLIFFAIVQAVIIFRKVKPDVVLGFGGFASGPGGVAAKLLGTPLVIHEQNAIAGTTNRLLAKIAQRVLAAFNGAFNKNSVGNEKSAIAEKTQNQIITVGNPVRNSIAILAEPMVRYQARAQLKEPLHLLILGGSLGAQIINETVPAALALLPINKRPSVHHQAGKNHLEATIAHYMQQQVNAKVDAFIEDMAAAYAWADVIICRAGALTVSEIMAAGVAAILIPLPSAIDDHQTHNAAILTRAHAGIAIAQHELSAEKLAALLLTKIVDRDYLQMLATNARTLALPQAAETVADICLEMVRG
jgi:UDP-N-acetylglucosamine--N-acetylmuramyl-(pentapeptide) pyrophosphoryl-undecaprenol N-acetylglucosamine transferase